MFNSNFFDTKKKLKELHLLLKIKNDSFINQSQLSITLSITPAMISRYLKDFESRSLIKIKKNSQKDYRYQLTGAGISYLNKLMKEYIQEISRLNNIFESEINHFQKELEIKVAITNSFGTIIPFLAQELGFFKRNQMHIRLVEYDNGEKLMEHFESEQFDFVLLGSVPAYLWKTYGAPIKVIASVDSGGHAIIVKNNSRINSISALKKKTILIPENTTVTNNLFRIFIKKHNEFQIDYDKDLIIINAALEKIENEFLNSNVDALMIWEPYISIFLSKYNNLKILHDFQDKEIGYLSNVIAVNEEFYKIYNNTVTRFIDILDQTIEYYKDHLDIVDQLISKKLKISLSVVQSARARTSHKIQRLL